MDLSSVVIRVEGLHSGELDGEAVLMSVQQGRYYGMDQIGTRIWQLIEKPMSVSELCDQLGREYEVGTEKCQRDVLNFLDELVEEKLVKVIDETAG